MPWSRIAFAEGFDSANCRWVRTVFQHLYEHASDEDFDTFALYRDKLLTGVTLYLSPRGTARLRAAMSRFDLVDCARPDVSEIELVIGAPLAVDPQWCEMTRSQRLLEAEAAYTANIEVDLDGAAGEATLADTKRSS